MHLMDSKHNIGNVTNGGQAKDQRFATYKVGIDIQMCVTGYNVPKFKKTQYVNI